MRTLLLLLLISLVLRQVDSSYRVREKATGNLIVAIAGISSHPVLLWGEKHQDQEIAARCKLVIRTCLENTVDAWVDGLG